MENQVPKDLQTIDDIQKRSAMVFKITVAVLTVLLGGGLSLITSLTSDIRALILYGAAMVVGGLGALGGALINWRTVLTRVRLLYYSQLVALFGLVGFLLGSAAFLFIGPPPPSPSAEDVEPPLRRPLGRPLPTKMQPATSLHMSRRRLLTAWMTRPGGSLETV